MYLFIVGALATQLSYILIQWFQLKYREYLLYAAYIFTFILYTIILFQEDILQIPESSINFKIIDGFKRPLAFLLYLEYFLFAQYFINLKDRFPKYYKVLQPLRIIICFFIAWEGVVKFLNIQPYYAHIIYYTCSIFLFVVFIIFIVKLWNTTDRLIKYLLWASLFLSMGGFLSNFVVLLNKLNLISPVIYNYYFIPTCLGAAFEIYFLNTGIIYKVSLAEKKLISTQKELITKLTENEILLTTQLNMRNKIAQDLHDDMGATLSGIALHSHLASRQIGQDNESVVKSLMLINTGAIDMVNNLKDVVWTVNPKNDSIGQMLDRLKEYSFNMAQAKSISVNWHVPENVDDIKLSMESRRNMYLICKEVINNAVKYSQCNELTITGKQADSKFILSIHDDGKGFELNDQLKGHGLKNMKARAEENKMRLEIETKKDKGTTIRLNHEITQ
jgi:signal transduction histidine kinase